jgi:hypothetical protein
VTAPLDLVLDRLSSFKLKQNGSGRWRACCPAHGGKNPTALSIGEGSDGRVLLQCWHGCDVDQVAGALGLELSDLFPPRAPDEHRQGPMKRRHLLTAGQALDVLSREADFVFVCLADIAAGKPIADDTRARAMQGAARITLLRSEVHA